ncbi:MAG: hypothetical protein BWY31_02125 [Lentisphaerae bacterium ADurb.Bin242]|nr:MAG: hypothetical protein BWY31_02125 [Lentisphaerae bacterium ADurb.Bin242]
MSIPRFEKILMKVLIGLVAGLGILFAAGIASIIYTSYRNPLDPIYQTDMTGFEFRVQSGRNADSRAARQRELQKLAEKFKLETLRCFLFRGHANRPTYCILMVGSIPPDADLSEYEPRTIQLKNPWVRSALKLSGAEVPEDDVCRDLEHYLLDRRVFVWRDRIVFSTVAANPTFLFKEADKRAFLEKYISPRKK